MNILLINPRTPDTFWSFKHAVRFVSRKASMAPLGLLTVRNASRGVGTSPCGYECDAAQDGGPALGGLCDAGRDDRAEESVQEILAQCAALGKTVIAGGPLFTTGYEAFPEVRHFVLGEAEEVMDQLVEDLRRGRLQRIYRAAERPEITRSPVPRWGLINFRNYVTMSVQFSRGCPFDCEFCDIIVMNGRVPRTKTPQQLIAELEALRICGWKDMVFIVDDNFIGNKKRTRELLRALIEWRRRTGTSMGFLTEAS